MEKYYIAKMVWHIQIETKSLTSEFDEQLRMIKASSYEKALNKAKSIGQQLQESFINSKGQQVHWQFINVEFIKEISSFDDNLEICSQTITSIDAQQYIQDINNRSLVNLDTNAFSLNEH